MEVALKLRTVKGIRREGVEMGEKKRGLAEAVRRLAG